jgi:hypothetical protein
MEGEWHSPLGMASLLLNPGYHRFWPTPVPALLLDQEIPKFGGLISLCLWLPPVYLSLLP